MLSIDQRIYLVFVGLIIVFFNTLHHTVKAKSFQFRAEKFFQLFLILLPIMDLKLPPADLNFKLFDVSILVFVLFNLKSLIKLMENYRLRYIILFLSLLFILSLLSEFPFMSILFDMKLLLVILLIYIIKYLIESGYDIYKKMLMPIVIWASIFFFIQIIFGVEYSLYQNMNEVAVREVRYTSFSQDPQKLAQLMFMIAILFLSRIIIRREFNSMYNWIAFILCIVIGLASGSRGGILGFGIAFILLYLNRISLKSILSLALIICVGYMAYEWLNSFQTFARMAEADEALEGRMQLFWLRAIGIFNDNFWFGIGPGNFFNYVTVHHPDFTYGYNGPVVDQPESGYLLWLCEMGIIGTLSYVCLLITTMIRKPSGIDGKAFKLALVVWLIGFVTVYSLSDIKILFIVTLCFSYIYSSKPKTIESK